ncbi:unnamed protein product [Closterium sp. NIES-54]
MASFPLPDVRDVRCSVDGSVLEEVVGFKGGCCGSGARSVALASVASEPVAPVAITPVPVPVQLQSLPPIFSPSTVSPPPHLPPVISSSFAYLCELLLYTCLLIVLITPHFGYGGAFAWGSEVLGFESQCMHFGHPSAGGCQRSTGDPRLILGKGYRHVDLGERSRVRIPVYAHVGRCRCAFAWGPTTRIRPSPQPTTTIHPSPQPTTTIHPSPQPINTTIRFDPPHSPR